MTIHPSLVLFTPYYRPQSDARWVELQTALARNLAAGVFRRVFLLVDTKIPGTSALADDRVTILPISRRPHYSDVFRHEAGTGEDWVVMANSDIIFDDTLNLLRMVGGQDKPPFICLTRHTFDHQGRWVPDPGAHGCQDAWAWRGWLTEKLITASERDKLRFGVWGSENRLAYEAHAAGYMVVNPGRSIVAKHYHWVDERPLGGRQHQIRGKYLFPLPQRMGDPIQASFGYCHGPGGFVAHSAEELATMPDTCLCSRCKRVGV